MIGSGIELNKSHVGNKERAMKLQEKLGAALAQANGLGFESHWHPATMYYDKVVGKLKGRRQISPFSDSENGKGETYGRAHNSRNIL